MLYWTILEKRGKVYVEAESKDAAQTAAQAMANEEGGPAYSVEVNPVPLPELKTVILIHRDGTRETVEWRMPESAEVQAVRRRV